MSPARTVAIVAAVRRRLGPWVWVLAWCALIFVLSSVPGHNLPEMPAANADKVVHAVVYAILGALCLRALRGTTSLRPAPAVALAVVLTTIYGVSDELHQLLTPGRSADVHDVMADAAGALLGALGAVVARFRR